MRYKIIKKVWATLKTPILLGVFVCSLCACQTLAFAYFGIKNPNKAVSKEKRLAYYQPFIVNNHKVPVKLYALSDTATWHKTVQSFYGYTFPRIYLRNTQTDSLYSLNCFEDVEWEINLINDHDLSMTDSGDEEKFTQTQKYIADSSHLIFESKKLLPDPAVKWNIQMVCSTFLGKKLRKRMLSILNLKGLGSLTILDISKIEK